jgi:hypothetical protein
MDGNIPRGGERDPKLMDQGPHIAKSGRIIADSCIPGPQRRYSSLVEFITSFAVSFHIR